MSANKPIRTPIVGQCDFAKTQWSLVLAAGELQQPAHDAMSRLCETYWFPLYAFARRRLSNMSEAEDLTQAFFAEMLEKNYVATATPDRGRFRAFLLTAFKHFLSKQREKARTLKRGGGRAPLSFDFAAADSSLSVEPAAGVTPEQWYDRQWAVRLLETTMKRLTDEFDRAGKTKQLNALRGFLIGDHAGVTYAQAAATLDTTEAAAKKAASRLRRRYRELIREEIAQTVSTAEEVDDEIRDLFAALES